MDDTKTTSKPSTTTSSAHPERFTSKQVIDTILQSKAKPLLIADGTAIELAAQIKKYGSKQISIVVLS